MGHRFQQQDQLQSHNGGGGSFSKEESRRATVVKAGSASYPSAVGRNRPPLDRAHGEDSGRSRNRTNASTMILESNCDNGSPLEENSFALEFRRGTSDKASGTPVKALINEEIAKEMEIRRPSPSPVARLMGLDTLPPQVVHKDHKKMGRSFQKMSSVGFQEKHVSYEDHSLWMSSKGDQEFKDVFEVMETLEIQRKKNQQVQKEKPSSKRSEVDLAYIRQKFMDAKRLSTDKTLHNSKELDDTLEVLDSNKDLFLQFLEEPNSLFTKHLRDLKCAPPSSHVSHITILKSSKGIKYETSEGLCKLERKAERSNRTHKEVTNFSRKPASQLACHSLKGHNFSPSHKLSKLELERSEGGPHPTRIVVLKPSLKKTQKTEKTISLPTSPENGEPCYRRHREFQISGMQELCAEGRDKQKLPDNLEDVLWRSRSSREIAREITKQMRETVRCSTRKVLSSGLDGCNREKISRVVSGMDSLYESEACRWSGVRSYDRSNNLSSPSYSTESSVSREAKKRLCERWKMTQCFQDVGPSGRGSSTLGEMLALADKEIPNAIPDSSTTQKVSVDNMASDGAISTWNCPTGISSRDGWKEGCSRNLSRSKSLPFASTVYGSSKSSCTLQVGSKKGFSMLDGVLNQGHYLEENSNRRGSSSQRSFTSHNHKPCPYNSGGVESKLPEREIHVNQEVKNSIHLTHLAEEKPAISENSEDHIVVSDHLAGDFSVLEFKDAKVSCIANEEHVEIPTMLEELGKVGLSSGHDHGDTVIEEISCGEPAVDCLRPSPLSEHVAAEGSKEIEHPSPVSVLEPPSEEEKSSPGCFERISADLKELRMQLRLLKMESTDEYTEEVEDMIMIEEDTGGECHSPLQVDEEILHAFRDETERDFSYLVDILIVSGVCGANWDSISDACHSTSYLVNPSIFDKLEKKYSVVVSWPRLERKLLFDLINSILAGHASSCADQHPWVTSKRRFRPILAHEDLVENVWQLVFKHQKELRGMQQVALEQRFLDLGNEVDIVGRDIESMLNDDLLEELVSEFILG